MSGPGKITVYMYTDWQLTAHFHEYGINGSDPKPEHKAWIKENVPKYRQRGMTALICGLASRTGTRQHNIKLSRARADGIAAEIQRLDWSGLVVDTRFALGEEVARVVGFKDGVEDGRWRGVFLDIYNPEKVRSYGPPLRPTRFVERRVAVQIPMSHKVTKRVPATKEDRDAEKWGRAGTELGQVTGATEPMPHSEKKELIDDTWDLVEVRVSKRDAKGDFVEMTWLDVDYTWRAPGGERVLIYDGRKRPITAESATNWLNRPVRTYRRELWNGML